MALGKDFVSGYIYGLGQHFLTLYNDFSHRKLAVRCPVLCGLSLHQKEGGYHKDLPLNLHIYYYRPMWKHLSYFVIQDLFSVGIFPSGMQSVRFTIQINLHNIEKLQNKLLKTIKIPLNAVIICKTGSVTPACISERCFFLLDGTLFNGDGT